MRMVPTAHIKLSSRRGPGTHSKRKLDTKVVHLTAPLKGLSRRAEITESDPQLAGILTNWIVEDDRITTRPGYIKIGDIPSGSPISTLIPYYSDVSRLAAAADGKLYSTEGAVLDDGYGSDDWAFVAFSNLSDVNYTIMVNGHDGVVSWDGTTFVVESVTAPPSEPWVNPLHFDKVTSHMNRLWFADSTNHAVFYLPIQQKTGAVKVLPLNALFHRGGHVVGIHTWSTDGGSGLDDALVIFSSNGEAVIYHGTDPDSATDWTLIGVFRFDAPMSKKSIINFGGDLYIMVSTGLIPMTTLLRAEKENLGTSDLTVMKDFEEVSRGHRNTFGWQVILNSQSNHAICNMPLGDGKYRQMVRRMPAQVWAKWEDVPSRCWAWVDNVAYFASDSGEIFRGGPEYLTDDGAAINVDVRFSWNNFGSLTKKNFKLLRLYVLTDGRPRPYMDIEVDYNTRPPTNQPELSIGASGGSDWDVSPWDTSSWTQTLVPMQSWQGVTGIGRVGAPRIRAAIQGASFSITGVDVIYEPGGLV